VSSLKCDRWLRPKSRESCLAAVCAASGILILQAVRLAARWPTCCLLAHGHPMGPTGMNGLAAGGRPAYWAQSGDSSEEKQIWYLKLGAILITLQSSLSPTYTSRTHTDTPTPLRVAQWAHLCGLALWLNGPPCKWSGVEWSQYNLITYDMHMVQLMPQLPIISCFIKIQNGLRFWC